MTTTLEDIAHEDYLVQQFEEYHSMLESIAESATIEELRDRLKDLRGDIESDAKLDGAAQDMLLAGLDLALKVNELTERAEKAEKISKNFFFWSIILGLLTNILVGALFYWIGRNSL